MTSGHDSSAERAVPEGMREDAAATWPPAGLIEAFLGEDDLIAWRPGELVPVDGDRARAAAGEFREALSNFASGITVITTICDGEPVGMTCQSFTSVSLDPPYVAFLPTKASRAFAAIRRARRFCVNFLAAGQHDVSGRFASRAGDKFAGIGWSATPTHRMPALDGVLGWVDCSVHTIHEAGDHYLVIGRVEDLRARTDGAPLLYFRSAYHELPAQGSSADS